MTATLGAFGLGLKDPVPLHAWNNGPVPVAETESCNALPEHTGELLLVVEMEGGVQLWSTHWQSTVHVSPVVLGLPSSQGVPGSAVPPGTPKQSSVHGPAFTGPLVTTPVTSCPFMEM